VRAAGEMVLRWAVYRVSIERFFGLSCFGVRVCVGGEGGCATTGRMQAEYGVGCKAGR
jgi:hypothetical protein